MPKAVKRGRLSAADMEYIQRFAGKKSVEEIASQLRRAPAQVGEYIADNLKEPVKTIGHALEDRPEWEVFRVQFDEDELKFLKYRYGQLMGQFGWDDVLPTEEMQVFQMIELEIMARQCMAERKPLILRQKAIQKKLEEAYGSGRGRAAVKDESEFADISRQLKEINTRHQSYAMQIGRLLETLKGTRDQRVKVVEGNRASFLGHLKALTLEEVRRGTGDEMELMRVAMEKEKKRMAKPHRYVDDTVDQPLLTSETVLDSYDQEEPADGDGRTD